MRKILETSFEWDEKYQIGFTGGTDTETDNDSVAGGGKRLWSRKQYVTYLREESRKGVRVSTKSLKSKMPKKVLEQWRMVRRIMERLPQGELRIRYFVQTRQLKSARVNCKFSRRIWSLEFNSSGMQIHQSCLEIGQRALQEFLNQIEMKTTSVYFDIESMKKNELHKSVVHFSPQAIGMILHEALGHRLEGDDYGSALQVIGEPNFEVFDSPGKPGWWGFTPVDDCFNWGRKFKLLKSTKNGFTTQLIRGENGNLRSSHLTWHPIIRQRNLETRVLSLTSPPQKAVAHLKIDKISEGSLMGDTVIISVGDATWTKAGRVVRLLPFTLEFNLQNIFAIQLYGKAQLSDVVGGCHKGLQRQLPISFYTHAGWCRGAQLFS